MEPSDVIKNIIKEEIKKNLSIDVNLKIDSDYYGNKDYTIYVALYYDGEQISCDRVNR